jgi:Ca-activated chloride channel family protein
MTTLQRATIILAAFGVTSILLTQVNSYSSNSRLITPTTGSNDKPIATVNVDSGSLASKIPKSSHANHTSKPIIVTNIYQTSSGSFYFEHATQNEQNKHSTNAPKYETAILQSTTADITITGQIARTKLTQVFSNTSEQTKTGVYVFPLPQDAAVDHLLMQIGDRKIEGLIKRKDIADEMYTQAKSLGKKASLMTQLRPNIFTNQIANIPPRSSIAVTIEYQQFIVRDKHNYALRLPLSITPRYQTQDLDSERLHISPTDILQTRYQQSHNTEAKYNGNANKLATLPAKTYINISLNTGLALSRITSDHHPIKTINTHSTQYEIELDTHQPANKDFVLNWQLSPSYKVQASHFTYQSKNYEYGLITLMPPANEVLIAKRNVVFIVDVSGSMVGEAITQAKQALALAIQDLQEDDYFNLVAFSSDATRLWPASQPATAAFKQDALSYIYGLEANGGTEIKKALNMAFALAPVENKKTPYLNQIIFVTDGSVSNEDDLMQTIYQQLGQYRLFTVAIGSAPNAYFMTQAAAAGKGTFTFIGDISKVKLGMQRLLEKLKRPALTNIKLNIKDAQQAFGFEVYPNILPDLYANEPLTISYRREVAASNIDVTLPFSVNGEFLTSSAPGDLRNRMWSSLLPAVSTQHQQGIHKYWARLKIKDLTQQLNMRGRSNESLNDGFKTVQHNIREGITNVALTHHLVSQFTSLIAIDHSMSELTLDNPPKTAKPNSYAQARLLQTATPSLLHALIGTFLIVLSGGLFLLTGIKK